MPDILTASGKEVPEWVRLLEWRYEELKRAGYPSSDAMSLAEARDVDLHEACDLLRNGATLEQALSILL